jgi:VanZ family protein
MGWVGVAAIVVLSLLPSEARPRVHLLVITQWEHFTAYFFTAGLLAYGRANRRHCLLIGLFLTALAAALEIGQIWVPGRDAKVSDWLAGASGGPAGIATFAIGRAVGGAFARAFTTLSGTPPESPSAGQGIQSSTARSLNAPRGPALRRLANEPTTTAPPKYPI